MKKRKLFLMLCAFAALVTVAAMPGGNTPTLATVVDRPDTSLTNSFYPANRAPLEPSRLISLPIGAVQPTRLAVGDDETPARWALRQSG